MSTSTSGKSQAAIDVALTGLAFQVITLVIFCGLLVDYLIRYFRFIARAGDARGTVDKRLKYFLTFLSTAIAMILARCAFRVDELSKGYSGPLIHNEPLFIGLEGVLIVCAVFALCVGHPGVVFDKQDGSEVLRSSMSEEMRILGDRK